MKTIFILSLFAITLAACKKTQTIPPNTHTGNKLAGKWTISTVTVIPQDSTGNAINSGTTYPEPSYFYFQFNANNSWVENLDPDPTLPLGETGSYVLHADTSFTLINKDLPTIPVQCKITVLTDTSFTFIHQKSTKFNGITNGYLEYIFKLKNNFGKAALYKGVYILHING